MKVKGNIWIPYGLLAAFVLAVLAMRSASALVWLTTITILALIALAIVNRVALRIWLAAKIAGWRADAKQLGLWLSLAFRRNRDANATATMAHQQMFLSGRLLSPMNLFALAAVMVVGGLGVIGIEEWRIHRIKRERDAPCTSRELSLNAQGQYRTSRQSCSSLGATLGVAVQWRERAEALRDESERRAASIRAEANIALATERARRARVEQSTARQRRRQNEAIIAALGGPPPDLERSVCELAGGVGCSASVANDDASAAASGDLPTRTGDAASGDITGIAALDPGAGQ